MQYNWLITGGCGFIGTNLIRHIYEQNLAKKIIVIDNLSVGNEDEFREIFAQKHIAKNDISAQADIHLIVDDIKNAQTAIDITKNIDIIVHLAANTGVQPSIANPVDDMEANIIGTVNYLEGARLNNVSKFIFASSGAPIGSATPPIHEELPCHPISPYGASKLSGEAYCSAYRGSYGIKTTALRFSNVYGPYSGKKGSVVAKFIRQALNNEAWVLNGGGQQTRDFIYVTDLVRAIALCATHENASNLYQVATNEETTIIELAEKLGKVIQAEFDIETTTKVGDELPGDVKRNYSDISKIKKEIGWEPTVRLSDGLVSTCEWFK